MEATFLELAAAVREQAAIEETVTARCATGAGLVAPAEPAVLAVLQRRYDRLIETERLLVALDPHEHLVRSIIRVGGLADFPDYTHDLIGAQVGLHALVRGRIRDIQSHEWELDFSARRLTTRFMVDRKDVVGIERAAPSLWPNRRS